MPRPLIPVKVLSSIPHEKGALLFLSNHERQKIVSLRIDASIGVSIYQALNKEPSARPITHDLFFRLMGAFGGKMKKMVITSQKNGIFYALLTFIAENEIMHKKIVDIDARPGDGIALAVRFNCPVYVSPEVWEQWEDDSPLYELVGKESPDSLLS